MKDIKVIGIDLAKTVFHIHGIDSKGRRVLRKKLKRAEVLPFFANLPHCIIGMEAGCGSHYWAREIMAMGHEVKLMSAQFVKPFVKTNKSDTNDAEAICEAVSRPSMRFVSVKTAGQQDIQSVLRVRQRLVQNRTAVANEIRGFLAEYGIVIKKGIRYIRKELPNIIYNEENGLTSMCKNLFLDLYNELLEYDEKIKKLEQQIEGIRKNHPVAKAISSIPGVGPLASTAIIALVSDPSLFKNGREFSAYLGLVPRHSGSGGKQKNYGISKRGNNYIRMVLIHGARAQLTHIDRANRTDRRSEWAKTIRERNGWNRAVVALANKNARTIWVAMKQVEEFKYVA